MTSCAPEVIRSKSLLSGDYSTSDGGFLVQTNTPLDKRQQHFEDLAADIEAWGEGLLDENRKEEHGWVEYHCTRLLRSTMNSRGQTQAFVKWMKDSRGPNADHKDVRKYPVMQVHANVDSPVELVCDYLSQGERIPEYNSDLMSPEYRDVEVLSPHSKIVATRTRQILVIKPRELITFNHHRWRADGTQVLVSQAYDENTPHGAAKVLRSVITIGRDPLNPQHTNIMMMTHITAGSDIPHWAFKACINAILPIESFKLVHNMELRVRKHAFELNSTPPADKPGRVSRPAGICLLGVACFWPEGGGILEESADSRPTIDNKTCEASDPGDETDTTEDSDNPALD